MSLWIALALVLGAGLALGAVLVVRARSKAKLAEPGPDLEWIGHDCGGPDAED